MKLSSATSACTCTRPAHWRLHITPICLACLYARIATRRIVIQTRDELCTASTSLLNIKEFKSSVQQPIGMFFPVAEILCLLTRGSKGDEVEIDAVNFIHELPGNDSCILQGAIANVSWTSSSFSASKPHAMGRVFHHVRLDK